MRDGRLWINGKMVARKRVEDFVYSAGNGHIVRRRQFIETLPNGRRHRIRGALEVAAVVRHHAEAAAHLADLRHLATGEQLLQQRAAPPSPNLARGRRPARPSAPAAAEKALDSLGFSSTPGLCLSLGSRQVDDGGMALPPPAQRPSADAPRTQPPASSPLFSETGGDPARVIAELRERDPVHWVPGLDAPVAWFFDSIRHNSFVFSLHELTQLKNRFELRIG